MSEATPNPQSPERQLTWTILLAKWTQIAKSSLNLPQTAEGDRWRAAVPAIINLQAASEAFWDMDDLHGEERAVAFDKGSVLIRTAAAELNTIWKGEQLPEAAEEIVAEALSAIAIARFGGIEWRLIDAEVTSEHPAELVAALRGIGFDGDLFLPTPGVSLFRGSPLAFARGPLGAKVPDNMLDLIDEFLAAETEVEFVPGFRQVYREFDFLKGGASRDVVQPFEGGVVAGQPLLVQAIEEGDALPVTLPPRHGKIAPVPVVFAEPEA